MVNNTKMGIDMDLALGVNAEDFQCSICWNLVEDAVTLATCEHSFCRPCWKGSGLENIFQK